VEWSKLKKSIRCFESIFLLKINHDSRGNMTKNFGNKDDFVRLRLGFGWDYREGNNSL